MLTFFVIFIRDYILDRSIDQDKISLKHESMFVRNTDNYSVVSMRLNNMIVLACSSVRPRLNLETITVRTLQFCIPTMPTKWLKKHNENKKNKVPSPYSFLSFTGELVTVG